MKQFELRVCIIYYSVKTFKTHPYVFKSSRGITYRCSHWDDEIGTVHLIKLTCSNLSRNVARTYDPNI